MSSRARLYVGIGDDERMIVKAGELVLLPRNDAHIMGRALDGEPVNS